MYALAYKFIMIDFLSCFVHQEHDFDFN